MAGVSEAHVPVSRCQSGVLYSGSLVASCQSCEVKPFTNFTDVENEVRLSV